MDEQRTVSFLLEKRTRDTEHVSLWRLASTQSKYDGPNQNGICMESCQHFYKLKANDKATFFSPAEKWVLPRSSARERKEREFVVDSGTSTHMVSEKHFYSAELETVRASECQSIVLVRHRYASSRNSRSAFIGETLRRTRAHVSLEKRSKTTSHQKWQEN